MFHYDCNVLKIKKFKCDIQVFASLLCTERACSPFFLRFQHHVDFCSLALTWIQIREDTELSYPACMTVFKYSSTLLTKCDRSPSWREKKITCCTDFSWLFLTTSLWGRMTAFPVTRDKAESTDDTSQGSKWRTREAETQEFFTPNSLLQKPRFWTSRHYWVISLFIAICQLQLWLLCVCQQSIVLQRQQHNTWSCPQVLLLYFTYVNKSLL